MQCRDGLSIRSARLSADVSVILCTKDRACDLQATLGAFASVTIPAGVTAELVVADNGSKDDTPRILEDARRRLDNFQVVPVCEPRPGKSRALNRALRASTGAVLLFTDDDVRPPVDWVERMSTPISDGVADAVAGGVRLAESLKRDWLTPLHCMWLASTEDKQRDVPHPMVGANMAISRHVLDVVPGFDPELGPGGIGHEDTLFWLQVREAGFRIHTDLSCEVEHHLSPSRLSRSDFIAMARRNGEFTAYLDHHWHHMPPKHARLSVAIALIRLWVQRLVRPASWLLHPVGPDWELALIERYHCRRQTITERARSHRYARHGFVKVQGELQ